MGSRKPAVVEAIEQITGIQGLIPDHNLYAGGFSLMEKGHYLNPHLDNFHDKDQQLFRALNLLIGDNLVRTAVRRTFGEKLFTNPHVYKRPPESR
jgi:hypothetical protein